MQMPHPVALHVPVPYAVAQPERPAPWVGVPLLLRRLNLGVVAGETIEDLGIPRAVQDAVLLGCFPGFGFLRRRLCALDGAVVGFRVGLGAGAGLNRSWVCFST